MDISFESYGIIVCCVAGRRRGGKGSKWALRREGLQGRYSFLCVFRPLDERTKFNELLNPSFWLVSDLLFESAGIFSHSRTFNNADKARGRFDLFLEEKLRSLEENGIIALKAEKEGGFLDNCLKEDLLAVLPTRYEKSRKLYMHLC